MATRMSARPQTNWRLWGGAALAALALIAALVYGFDLIGPSADAVVLPQ